MSPEEALAAKAKLASILAQLGAWYDIKEEYKNKLSMIKIEASIKVRQ